VRCPRNRKVPLAIRSLPREFSVLLPPRHHAIAGVVGVDALFFMRSLSLCCPR
jgi:hypothetical protein